MTRARTVRVCVVRGCERRTVGRGLCRRHYDRVRRGATFETEPAAAPPAARPARPRVTPRLDPVTRRLLAGALEHHPLLAEELARGNS